MKLKRMFIAMTIGFAFTGQPAKALVYTAGDLFLGFRATGSTGATQDYLVNIGQYTQFTTSTNTFTLNLGSLGADLSLVYGNDWYSRSDLFWSISGTPYDGALVETPTLYVTRQRSNVNTPATAWLGRSNSAQTTTASAFQALAGNYVTTGSATANSSVATFQNVGDPNSYASFIKPTLSTDFNVWNTIQGSFANGTAGSVLDLFAVNPVFNQTSVRQGSFQLNNSGELSFTGAAVPEPSTVTLIGLGAAVGLYMVRKRRNTTALTS